jgi:thiol-disulfide isomerase/thioredoxin
MKEDFENYQKSNKGLSPKFIKYENTNFAFIRVNQKGVFANNYSNNHKDSSALSPGFSDYLKSLKYNDASLLPSPRFRDFVRNIRFNETFKMLSRKPELADSSNGNIKAMFIIIDSLFTNQTIKNYSLYTTLRFELRQFGLAIPVETINEFYKKCTDNSYVAEIRENYYIWTTLKKGNDAPAFSVMDLSGKQVSLKDFEGKYVYIDVWATWCAPCIKEMPALDSLMYVYRDNNEIKFVKISIDVNKIAWENKVKKETASAAFTLWAENGANSDFAKAYAIKDVPRYIITDKKGKIIDAQALPPSQIKKQIEKILQSEK